MVSGTLSHQPVNNYVEYNGPNLRKGLCGFPFLVFGQSTPHKDDRIQSSGKPMFRRGQSGYAPDNSSTLERHVCRGAIRSRHQEQIVSVTNSRHGSIVTSCH